MLSSLMSRFWWVLLLRGVMAILFGIATYAWPGLTLSALVLLVGAFALVDGVSAVFHAFSGRKDHEHWWVLLFEGLLGIAFGVITFQAPGITAQFLMLYLGFWAMATGVLRVILAVRLRKEIEGEWWLVTTGLTGIVFGLFMVARPGAGALAVLWLVAMWSILTGVFTVALAFAVRGLAGRLGGLKGRLAGSGSA